MKTFRELGIEPRKDGKRTKCPLCDTEDSLSVFEAEGLFNCVSCSQNGSLETGWFDDTALKLGYIPLDDTELIASVYDAHLHGMERGRPTGWASLDEHYTVRKGDVTVISGTPGHGKSEWLDA